MANREYEDQYTSSLIVGVDEAGRGPLAGPLVVAGVILEKSYNNDEINDSKKLTEKKREKLFDEIISHCIDYRIYVVDEQLIDNLNIYQATKVTMESILASMKYDVALIDAVKLDSESTISIIKGDQKSISIAAASILAKVYRDRLMKKIDLKYPEYGFKSHKGYGTKMHLAALNKFGVLRIHRRSYRPVYELIQPKLDI